MTGIKDKTQYPPVLTFFRRTAHLELGQLWTFVVLKRSGFLCAELETEERAWARGSLTLTALLWGTGLYSRAVEERETQSLPFGGDIWDVGKKDVQDILLVAKNKIWQRDAEAKSWVSNLVKEFG